MFTVPCLRRTVGKGAFMKTNRPLDVALTGPGFIPVTSPNGDVQYTRDGSFKLDKDGYLITNDGYLVGDGIKVPVNHEGLRIKQDGTVLVIQKGHTEQQILGKIPVVQFQNYEGLKPVERRLALFHRLLWTGVKLPVERRWKESGNSPFPIKKHTKKPDCGKL